MGVRLYNRSAGTFTSLDPHYGGNLTSYGYPVDPVNQSDTTGNGALLELGPHVLDISRMRMEHAYRFGIMFA
jgi:hypothetical protein